MKHKFIGSSWIVCVLSLALALPQGVIVGGQAAAEPPAGTNADTGWPRTVQLKGGIATWYQPQVESWPGQKNIVAYSAVAYQMTGAKEPALGTIKIEGPTTVSLDERLVAMDLRITEYNFKTLTPDQVKALVAEVQARPQNDRVIDLDRVVAYVADSPLQVRNVDDIKADPPKFLGAGTRDAHRFDGDPIWS
jgi:hypothetical protein